MNKWDQRFLDLAAHIAQWSKDGTKVGAVIVDPDRRVVATGYNGGPKGTDDSPVIYADRTRKLRRTVHAEPNALLFACRPVVGCTAFTWPFSPCAPCAAMLIQSGIKRVVAPVCPPSILDRWYADLQEAEWMFAEAGVELCIVPAGDGGADADSYKNLPPRGNA